MAAAPSETGNTPRPHPGGLSTRIHGLYALDTTRRPVRSIIVARVRLQVKTTSGSMLLSCSTGDGPLAVLLVAGVPRQVIVMLPA